MDLHDENRALVPPLTTARLTLRALSSEDLDDVVRLCGDYDLSKMLTQVPHPYTRADADHFLQLDRDGALDLLWMIHDANGLCGTVSIGSELGYWLGKHVWGRGYMTEATEAAITCYFAQRRTDQIVSSHFVDNAASRNVLEKLGFVDTGPHVHFSNSRQTDVPGRTMRLTRADWQARHG